MNRKRKLSRGAWEVQRERCRIEDPYPPSPAAKTVPVGSLLGGIMKRLGLDEQHWAASLEAEWPAIVGPVVAAHSRPGPLQNKKLVVYIDSPVWLSELHRVGRARILEKLRARVGGKRILSIGLELDPGT